MEDGTLLQMWVGLLQGGPLDLLSAHKYDGNVAVKDDVMVEVSVECSCCWGTVDLEGYLAGTTWNCKIYCLRQEMSLGDLCTHVLQLRGDARVLLPPSAVNDPLLD